MYSVLLANARWERTFGTPCSGQYNRLELVRINEVRARTTFRMSQATNSSLICFVLYKKHVWTSFFASRNFPKTSRFYWSTDFFSCFFFCHDFFANFLTFLTENTNNLFRTLSAWPWVSEICRGCQEPWRGCPRGSVGVLTPTVEYNSPPTLLCHIMIKN